MPRRNLGRGEWKSYFERISRELVVAPVNINVRVEAPDLGNLVQDHELACRGFTYDDRDELFELHGERAAPTGASVLHRIERPGEIRIDEGHDGLALIELFDGAGRHHVVRLARPVSGADG